MYNIGVNMIWYEYDGNLAQVWHLSVILFEESRHI